MNGESGRLRRRRCDSFTCEHARGHHRRGEGRSPAPNACMHRPPTRRDPRPDARFELIEPAVERPVLQGLEQGIKIRLHEGRSYWGRTNSTHGIRRALKRRIRSRRTALGRARDREHRCVSSLEGAGAMEDSALVGCGIQAAPVALAVGALALPSPAAAPVVWWTAISTAPLCMAA